MTNEGTKSPYNQPGVCSASGDLTPAGSLGVLHVYSSFREVGGVHPIFYAKKTFCAFSSLLPNVFNSLVSPPIIILNFSTFLVVQVTCEPIIYCSTPDIIFLQDGFAVGNYLLVHKSLKFAPNPVAKT
jgi:hypothetical protein